MNLGIEYLIRNGAIRKFFETPSSLFVESADNSTKMALCFRDSPDCSNLISVDHWQLNDDHQLPRRQFYRVKREELFTSPIVIIPNVHPIGYLEGPIQSSLNQHNHPMRLGEYNVLYDNFLNSLKNKAFKADWLWDAFARVNLNGTFVDNRMDIDLQERRFIIEHEKRYVRNRKPDLWKFWCAWERELIFDEEVSHELIFSSAYKSRRLILKPSEHHWGRFSFNID